MSWGGGRGEVQFTVKNPSVLRALREGGGSLKPLSTILAFTVGNCTKFMGNSMYDFERGGGVVQEFNPQ